MDGRHENHLPSIKTAQIMDSRHGNQLPSIKTAQIMDGRHGNQLPSIKTAQIMDSTLCALPGAHEVCSFPFLFVQLRVSALPHNKTWQIKSTDCLMRVGA